MTQLNIEEFYRSASIIQELVGFQLNTGNAKRLKEKYFKNKHTPIG